MAQDGGGNTGSPGGGAGANMDPEERRRRFQERLAKLTGGVAVVIRESRPCALAIVGVRDG